MTHCGKNGPGGRPIHSPGEDLRGPGDPVAPTRTLQRFDDDSIRAALPTGRFGLSDLRLARALRIA